MKAYVVAPETIHDQAMFGEYAKAGGIMATYPRPHGSRGAALPRSSP
jgi:hypothetical protein